MLPLLILFSGLGGATALLGFAVAGPDYGSEEDTLGQVQPGAFSDAVSFLAFLKGHSRYRTLANTDEYKVHPHSDRIRITVSLR